MNVWLSTLHREIRNSKSWGCLNIDSSREQSRAFFTPTFIIFPETPSITRTLLTRASYFGGSQSSVWSEDLTIALRTSRFLSSKWTKDSRQCLLPEGDLQIMFGRRCILLHPRFWTGLQCLLILHQPSPIKNPWIHVTGAIRSWKRHNIGAGVSKHTNCLLNRRTNSRTRNLFYKSTKTRT